MTLLEQKSSLKRLRYDSHESAVNDHKKNYRSAGGLKGKFDDCGPDRYRIKKITDAVRDESRVLDIGCNDGSMGEILQRVRGCTAFGVDVVPELVDAAQNKGVLARVGVAEMLPFPENKFDVVIMAEVMEHLYEPIDALKQIVKVMKPEGKFLGSVPHPDGRMGRKHPTGGDYHNYIFEVDQLEELLGGFFSIVNVTSTPYFEDYCELAGVDKEESQWLNWVCEVPRK